MGRIRGGRKMETMEQATTREEVASLYGEPLFELVHRAQILHRQHFDPAVVQVSTLLSIKTGGCPEDCGYCPQAARYHANIETTRLLSVEEVLVKARQALDAGADRFCMGAAWRSPRPGEEFERVLAMVREVKALGLETCCTLGMLNAEQAQALASAGLDYYNHNIDTSAEYYSQIITTRSYEDRLATLARVREAGIGICTGGILGLGETDEDRISFLHTLASLDPQPESVTINALVPMEGTPLADQPAVDPLLLVRVIACARLLMPEAAIRLSAGRLAMSEESQFLCFLAGANSIFAGERLLTTANAHPADDRTMLSRLGYRTLRPCSS